MVKCMKKRIFLIVSLLVGCFLLNACTDKRVRIIDHKLINSSDNNDFLHVSFQLDDFYNPFITNIENENLIKNFPQKNIKIIAQYEPIIDKTGDIIKITKEKQYHTLMSWESRNTVYNKINQIAFATNIHVNKTNQIINFDIPKPIKTPNQQYVLEGIYLYYPDFHPSKSYYFPNIDTVKYIPIFYNKIVINKLVGYKDRFIYVEPLKLDVETDRFVDSSSKKLLVKNRVFKTSVWFKNDNSLEKKPLSEDEKIDFFDQFTIEDSKDYKKITIPNSMLNWANVDDTFGSYYKGKTFEILELKGSQPEYNSRETWVKQNGNLIHITHGSFEPNCTLNYQIVFEKGKNPRRYIFKTYWNESRYNNIEFRKINITQENLNIFEKIKQQKEDQYNYYLELIEKNLTGEDAAPFREKEILKKNNLKHACIREIDNMKRLLTTPKEKLKQEFEVYKKTINKQ
jgi:hypothetical protein